ncbi:MAG: hypothetical protein K0R84_1879, partial [Clostridia bacterium]|nr:hypothetical protein [Clostridia bacterium]
ADGTAAMNVNAAGNVGIGTAAPSAKLDVQGDAKISGSINAASASVTGSLSAASADIIGALNAASATVSGNISAASATVNGGLSALNADITDTLNAVNAVISGNLTVGSGIEVLRGLDSKAQLIWDETTDKWQAGILGSLKELSYSDHKHENLYTADGVIAMNVDAVGNIGIGKIPDPSYKLDVDGALQVVTLAQTSSQSYKENIEQLKDKTALDLLAKLKPVSFDFKAHNTKKHNIGFIAEEVPDVFATSDHKAVSLMDIIGVLTAVVKMQQKETTSMKKQMKALEKQIASLVGA